MTCEELLRALVGVSLLTEEDAQSVNQRLASSSSKSMDAGDLAGRLVRAGKLTQFQANQVLAGKAKALVLGDYVLLDKIGAGGMGQVFQAQHRRMKRIVALKVLPAAALEDAGAVKRFEREVEAAAKLIHPNIVISYDAGHARGQHYLVMEYVAGRDLLSHLKERGQFSVDRALDYMLQAARGLVYAHSEGIVHRDIKPANLLLDAKGTIKILDMGLARIDDAAAAKGDGLTQTGQVMGTVDYMAPEQAFDTHRADARADIYSLGCTLYRLLVNENMYSGDSLVKKLIAHREGAIPTLRSKRPDVSQALDDVYLRMVAKKPEDRFQTMAEVLEALETCRSPAHVASPAHPLAALSGLRLNAPGTRGGGNKPESGSGSALSQGTVGSFSPDVSTDPKSDSMFPRAGKGGRPVELATGTSAEKAAGDGRKLLLWGGVGAGGLIALAGVGLMIVFLTRGDDKKVAGTDPQKAGVETVDPDVGGNDAATTKSGTTATGATTDPTTTSITPVSIASTANQFTPPAETPAAWHDLLAPVDVTLDRLWGDWVAVVDRGLQANANAANADPDALKSAMLVLPIAPAAEYQLRIKVQFVAGTNSAVVVLPVEKRQVAFAVGVSTGGALHSGFEQISGQRVDKNGTETSVIKPTPGGSHQLDFFVLPCGPEVELYALWDGQPASHWKGPLSQLSALPLYAVTGEPAIGLVSENSTVQFEKVELGLISGNVRYRRSDVPQIALNVQTATTTTVPMPAATVPTASQPADLSSGGIDLLALLKPAQHSFRGLWKLDGPILESDLQTNGSGVYFPVFPPDEYRFEVVAERLSGSDCLTLGLANETTEFALHVDGNVGTTLTLVDLDGKSHTPDNPTLLKHSTFAPGRIVRLRCEVTKGGVRMLEDGVPVFQWQGDFSRLTASAYHARPVPRTLCLVATNSVYRIYEARLLPLSAPETSIGPDPAALAAAVAKVRSDFQAEYDAAKKPEQQATLALSLLSEAQRAGSEPIQQLALWEEARRLSLAAGDVQTALTALRQRHVRFPLNFLLEAATVVEAANFPASRKDEYAALSDLAADLYEQAIAADRFDATARLGAAALSAARKAGDRDRTRRVTDRQADVKDIQDEYAKIAAALATLKTAPADPAACLALGRYQCFSKCDWAAGLPNLVRGSDPALKATAEKELENPQVAASQVTVAAQWWEIGGKLPRSQRKNVVRHAAEWYLLSMTGLSPAQRATALNRIDEAAKAAPAPPPSLPQGLVAYWGFDEGQGRLATDAVGKSHALVHNAKWARGVSGGGLQMTGPGDNVHFPLVGVSDKFTVAMWVKLDRTGTEFPLFMTQGLQPGAVHISSDAEGGFTGAVVDRIATGAAAHIPFSKWSHVAVTCDGGTIVSYIDGVESARNTGGKTNPSTMPRIGPGRIGLHYSDDPARHLHGVVDDVRVYATALTARDILQLANTTAPRSRD